MSVEDLCEFKDQDAYGEAMGFVVDERWVKLQEDPEYIAARDQLIDVLETITEDPSFVLDVEIWVKHDNPAIRQLANFMINQKYRNVEKPEKWIVYLIADSEIKVRDDAVIALKSHYPYINSRKRIINNMIRSDDKKLRLEAIEIFADNIQDFKNPIVWIKPHLDDDSIEVVDYTAMIIGISLPSAKSFESVVEQFWGNPLVRRYFMDYLKWNKHIKDREGWIIKGVNDIDYRVRAAAIDAMGKCYYTVPNHRNIIIKALEDESIEVRYKARTILEFAILDWEIRNRLGTWHLNKEEFGLDY